jgi:hypothetical protein
MKKIFSHFSQRLEGCFSQAQRKIDAFAQQGCG